MYKHLCVCVDLRWNNIGVLGGRKLLFALKGNTSLVILRVEGNSIPADITEAIGRANGCSATNPVLLKMCEFGLFCASSGASISLRLTQHVMEAQHYAESKELSQQMQQLHSDAQQKVSF